MHLLQRQLLLQHLHQLLLLPLLLLKTLLLLLLAPHRLLALLLTLLKTLLLLLKTLPAPLVTQPKKLLKLQCLRSNIFASIKIPPQGGFFMSDYF